MRTLFALIACAALAACSGSNPIENNSVGAQSLPDPNQPTASAGGNAPTPGEASRPLGNQSGGPPIPAALHGRWGMSPGDCTSTRGDAKGLLVIDSNSLKFYESRAVPTPTLQTSPNSANGQFNFVGEGQQWARYEALELQENTLVRTERDPLATFTYARC